VLVQRIVLTLAAAVAVGAAVPPALGVIDAHSAPLSKAPFGRDVQTPHLADPAIGRDWRVVALPSR
jgi:hypothetical protein